MAIPSSQDSTTNRQAQPLLGPLPFETSQESPGKSNPIKRKPVATASTIGNATTASLSNKAGQEPTTAQVYSRIEDVQALSPEEYEAEEASDLPSCESYFFQFPR